MPDPSTLDDSGEEDNLVAHSLPIEPLSADQGFKPLKVVQQKLESRQTSAPPAPQPQPRQQNINLFDDLSPVEPPRSTTAPPGNKNQPPPKSAPAPPKSTKPADSLLGLDFFGSSDLTPARPASVNPNPVSSTASSRPDLNRSILSLYASKPQPRPQQAQNPLFSGVSQSPNHQQEPSSGLGGLSGAFGGLGFASQSNGPSISTMTAAQPAAPKPSPFANLTAGMIKSSAGSQLSPTSSSGFFGSSTMKQTPYPKPAGSSALDDLFDFSSTSAPAPVAAPAAINAFNISAAASKQPTTPQFSFDTNAWATPAATISTAANNESAWGTSIGSVSVASNAWGSPATTSISKPSPSATMTPMVPVKSNDDDEWGAFSAGGSSTTSGAPVQSAGFGQDDLFGNVWK